MNCPKLSRVVPDKLGHYGTVPQKCHCPDRTKDTGLRTTGLQDYRTLSRLSHRDISTTKKTGQKTGVCVFPERKKETRKDRQDASRKSPSQTHHPFLACPVPGQLKSSKNYPEFFDQPFPKPKPKPSQGKLPETIANFGTSPGNQHAVKRGSIRHRGGSNGGGGGGGRGHGLACQIDSFEAWTPCHAAAADWLSECATQARRYDQGQGGSWMVVGV